MNGLRCCFFLILSLICVLPMSAQKSKKSKSAPKLYEKGTKAVVINLAEQNSTDNDISPAYYLQGIVYMSKKGGSTRNMFISELAADGKPMSPRPFSIRVETKSTAGSVAFGKDGTVMYFSRPAEAGKGTGLRLFEATKGSSDWQLPKELPFNGDTYSVCHPSLSADGKTLYFSSDMPGGQGGFDIYVTRKLADGSWSAPVNLGNEINTEQHEGFPFIHPNGTLFFSSRGHGSRGKLDVFMTSTDDDGAIQVSPMLSPINSAGDDYGFILNEDGTSGFLTSDRSGGLGEDDLYMFKVSGTIEDISKSEAVVAVKTQHADGSAIGNVHLAFFPLDADEKPILHPSLHQASLLPNTPNDSISYPKLFTRKTPVINTDIFTRERDGGTRQALVAGRNYLLCYEVDGYFPGSKTFFLPDTLDGADLEMPITLTPIGGDTTYVVPTLNLPLIKAGAFVLLDDITYEFKQSANQATSSEQLDLLAFVLQQHPEMKIELTAHTETYRDKDFAKRLSTQRAESAKRYLLARGARIDQVVAMGKGCDVMIRGAQSRRIEVRVLTGEKG